MGNIKRLLSGEVLDYIGHIVLFGAAFMVIGHYLPKIYFERFDRTVYYDIINPITVENKRNEACTYIDAYIHRIVRTPIQGTSVKQLTLVREDSGLSERIASYTTEIQANVGEGVMIAHWPLPCDIRTGTYYFEGTVSYRVNDVPKTTHFITENFEVVSTSSGEIHGQ